MSARAKSQKILSELRFDFKIFTMDRFIQHVSIVKKREIFTYPWDMPATLFGAWVSDAEQPNEYIFYRKGIPETHQIHVQLHELCHFLFGHPTLRVNRQHIANALNGAISLPFAELPRLRSKESNAMEIEVETLAGLIQKYAIQNSKLDQLIHNTQPEEKLTGFLKNMGAQ